MTAILRSCAFSGIDAFAVDVETVVAPGNLPAYHVVGLPTAAVREGAVRIRSALEHIGHGMPRKKITINLAPADRKKEGAAFDLPIATAILAAEDLIDPEYLRSTLILGELGLDGTVRGIRGALSAAILARDQGLASIIVPSCCAPEAAEVDGIRVIAVSHLSEVVAFARGELVVEPASKTTSSEAIESRPSCDMSEVRGQDFARGALEVAVAGGHNLLLVGPPGIGKTMLARRIPTILPPLSRGEALETTRIYSSLSLNGGRLMTARPFRGPHHSISAAALVGGGSPPKAGELSLAHNGVLFLDELPEFQRSTLEALRQPLEDRQVVIGRVSGRVELPASVLLAASANPCPCGWLGSEEKQCVCSLGQIERYRTRLSGPLLDRMDLQIYVSSVRLTELRDDQPSESSAKIRERVQRAREIQAARLEPFGCRTNAEMSPSATRKTCRLTDQAERSLEQIHKARQGMSARAVDRVIKVARTIADLTDQQQIDEGCILEAATYRSLDSTPAVGMPKSLVSEPKFASNTSASVSRSTTYSPA